MEEKRKGIKFFFFVSCLLNLAFKKIEIGSIDTLVERIHCVVASVLASARVLDDESSNSIFSRTRSLERETFYSFFFFFFSSSTYL